MALLCVGGTASAEKRFIAVASGANVTVAEETDSQSEKVSLVTLKTPTKSSGVSVVAMTVSRCGQLLAVYTSDKRLVVWECALWRVRGERSVNKRVTSLQFSEAADYLLTADKTGEVIRYRTSDIGHKGEELLGHLSMLLDMVIVSHDGHVITCDRDEKIRVSRYPNSYNIETYCLGHTEFVSCLCLCEKWPHMLISASGDGTVRSWEWRRGHLLDTYHCSLGDKVPAIVTQVICTRTHTPSLVVASLEKVSELVTLALSCDGKFKCCSTRVPLQASPWSCAFDWSDRLWVCLPHQQDPVQCWTCDKGEFQRCSNTFHQSLNNWELFKDGTESRDWSGLCKHTYDNVSEYLARKEERIHQKATAKFSSVEVAVVPPPQKKAKPHPLNSQS